jgi:hypothetical protein
VNDIEVAGKDSAYIFVTVSINPSAANLPFIVRDSIALNYNGNTHYVQLDAFGQNARFFRNLTITGNETWNKELPYVIWADYSGRKCNTEHHQKYQGAPACRCTRLL